MSHASALLDLLRNRPSARIAGPEHAPFLLAAGQVPVEYAAARERCVLFDQSASETVVASGADAAAFLHRLLANDVKSTADGERHENLLLSAKGKVRFQLALERRGATLRLAVAPEQGKALLDALEMYHFSEDVAFALDESCARLELCGPRAAEVLRAAGVDAPERGSRRVVAQGLAAGGRGPIACHAADALVAGSPGFVVEVRRAECADAVLALEAAGALLAGRAARDILRVEACHAEAPFDVDEGVYPQEARLERAFSLDKGCYIGQEVVAKIDTYGGLNKRLVPLRISHDDPLPRGAKLLKEEDGETRELGVATSWSWSFVLDTGLALGFVKRRHQAPGTRFALEGGGEAVVVEAPVRPDAVRPTGEFESRG
jgi:folate-binding protein YgfZ